MNSLLKQIKGLLYYITLMNPSMAENSKKVSIEERFARLQKALERSEVGWNPKIQRVAHSLVGDGTMHYGKYFSPKLMSLGPIHYGAPKLQLGEQYKQMWAAMFLSSTNQIPQHLYTEIAENVVPLKQLFAPDLFTANHLFSNYSDQGFHDMDEMISWTLFVDGCALLRILEHAQLHQPEKMNVKVVQLILVLQDVLLLENQLPYALLKLLWRGTNEVELIETMKQFLRYDNWAAVDGREVHMEFPPPAHLLHLQRSIILYDIPPKHDYKYLMITNRNIMELKAAGIELKSSKTCKLRDISFSLGRFRSELTLPQISVDDTSATFLLNLIACEMCPDFENEYGICDYVSFLNSLIDTPDDVKALRSARILLNTQGSDQDVLNFFTTISSNLVPSMGRYACVMAAIEKHYCHKSLPTWIALGYNTYFSNPWAIIAFLAALLGLLLTFIQTWCTIHPPK